MLVINKLNKFNFKNMSWKNGGGVTTELAIEPSGYSLSDNFTWRISTAYIAKSGPFSMLTGIDRTILLLSGCGIKLDYGSYGSTLISETLKPVKFAGEWTTKSELLNGPCIDFNVMTRRSFAKHTVEVIYLNSSLRMQSDNRTTLLFCTSGAFNIVSSQNITENTVCIGELIRFNGFGSIDIEPKQINTIIIVVSITIL